MNDEFYIPDEFEFLNSKNTLYKCRKVSNDSYNCIKFGKSESSSLEFVDLPGEEIKRLIKSGIWQFTGLSEDNYQQQIKTEEKQMNGVDAQGAPKNFTMKDLKPMMRAVAKGGTVYIALSGAEKHDGIVLCRDGGFIDVMDSPGSDYHITEIYNPPSVNQFLLSPTVMGDLVWKRSKPLTAQQQAIIALENSIKESQTKLEALKKGMK